jgi:hypothetical protein
MRYMMLVLSLFFFNTQILANDYSVRLMILKHSYEQMCNDDANLAINGLNEAKRSGLNATLIENKFTLNITDFKKSIEQKIKTNSKSRDTLIIFTIGHGFQTGQLQNLGNRSTVMNIIASTAEKYNQKIIWWQLSCYAQAYLPRHSSLNIKQQSLFSVVSSSFAHEPSPVGEQGRHMRQVFMALAKQDKFLDKNSSGDVSTEEFKVFLDLTDFDLGKRLSAKTQNKIFEKDRIILKIIDKNNKQGKYEENYILIPNSF